MLCSLDIQWVIKVQKILKDRNKGKTVSLLWYIFMLRTRQLKLTSTLQNEARGAEEESTMKLQSTQFVLGSTWWWIAKEGGGEVMFRYNYPKLMKMGARAITLISNAIGNWRMKNQSLWAFQVKVPLFFFLSKLIPLLHFVINNFAFVKSVVSIWP